VIAPRRSGRDRGIVSVILSSVMDWTRFKFALPTTLVVTTFVSAYACQNGQVYCVDIEKKSKCENEPSCLWDSQDGTCESVCYSFEDQSDCEAVEGCFWEEFGASETSGADSGLSGSCHEPHT
jgi:hypothetical protein